MELQGQPSLAEQGPKVPTEVLEQRAWLPQLQVQPPPGLPVLLEQQVPFEPRVLMGQQVQQEQQASRLLQVRPAPPVPPVLSQQALRAPPGLVPPQPTLPGQREQLVQLAPVSVPAQREPLVRLGVLQA